MDTVHLCLGVLLLPFYRGSSRRMKENKTKKKTDHIEYKEVLGHNLKWFFSPYTTRRTEIAFAIF